MTLLHPWWLLPAFLLLLAYLLVKGHQDDDWKRVIPRSVLDYLQGGRSPGATRRLELLIASVLCAALTGPSMEAVNPDTYRHSQGWIILADVSRSMTLNDTAPSRLSAMRNTALALAEHAKANSTTLIVYAGDAFIVSPPSFDDRNIQQNINLLNHGIVPVEGSNLTRALALALSVVEGSQLVNARLFVLSDTGGFNNRSDAAVSRLAQLGHRTDVILFGRDSSDTAAPFDLQNAKSLANSGKGKLLRSDSIGQLNLNSLDLQSNISDKRFLTLTGLSSIRWQNQSHWLLLLLIPLLLWLFHREWQR